MCYKVTTFLLFISAYSLSLNIGSVFGKGPIVDPGEKNVVLKCSFSSQVWLSEKDNKTITADDKKYKLDSENGTLIVLEADSTTMGVYICQDKSSSSTEKITLYVTPYVKHFDKSKNMIQDDPLQLECKGYGYPTPVVQWFRRDLLLVADEDRITLKDTLAQSDSSLMINGTIRIERMTYDDAGDYKCVATNDYGFNNATIAVKVKDKLAALWPFLGICAEVAILCTIIFIYEKRRAKRMEEEENKAVEESERLNANNDTKVVDDVRQRK